MKFNISEKFINYWQSRIVAYWNILSYLLVIGLIVYGYRAFNNYLYADDFFRVNYPYAFTGLQSGRFMMSAVWYLTGIDFSPTFSTTLFFLISAGSSVIIAQLIGAKDGFNVFLFSSLMLFNPIMCRHFQFLPHHLPMALGFMLVAIVSEILHSTMQARFANRPFPIFYALFLCSFLQAMIIGVRQDYATLSCILFISILLKLALEQSNLVMRQLLSNIVFGSAMFVLSLVIYYLLNEFSLYYTQMSEIRLYETFDSVAFNRSDLMQAFTLTKNSMSAYYLEGDRKIAWGAKVLIAMITGMMVVSIFVTAWRKYCFNVFVSISFALFVTSLILVLPWSIAMFRNFGNSTGPTALLGLVATWPVLFSYVSVNGLNLMMRRFAKFAGIVTLVFFVSFASRLSFKLHTSFDQLKIVTAELLHDVHHIMDEKGYSATDPITLVLVNSARNLLIEDCYTFMEWVFRLPNNDPRITIAGESYFSSPEVDGQRLRDLVLSMPEWPAKGYIRAEGNVIIVKLNSSAPSALGNL